MAVAVALVALSGLSSAPPARAASRAPGAGDYRGISSAFSHDSRPGHRHAHDRIVEIRETVGGSPVARAFFARLRARRATSRGNGDIGQCGNCSDYYFKPTGQWKPDPNVTKSIRDQLKEAPNAWDVRFQGSGTDQINASAPGDTASNPYCNKPPVIETSGATFSFGIQFSPLGVDGLSASGVGSTTGNGSHRYQEQPGCVNNNNASSPQTNSCTDQFFTPVFQKAPHAQLSGAVNRGGFHELRLHAPAPMQRPLDCASPDEWWLESQGPILFIRSVLVPDSSIVAGSTIRIPVGDKRGFPCFLPAGYKNSKCGETVEWTGTITLTPLPDWRKLSFSG
jgi:hypothetical protein